MATKTTDTDLTQRMIRFLRNWYQDQIGQLANEYPKENRSLRVDYSDLYSFEPDIADDYRQSPDQLREYIEEALRQNELPVDVSLGRANVRVYNLPEPWTYYPDEFSPTEHHGTLRAIKGEISKATEIYSRMREAGFECKRCGTLTRIPQVDGDFQEPHECQGCERQGPFRINYEQSNFVDAQKLRVKTPPERTKGDGKDIDGFVEDDLCGKATVGDRVTAVGQIQLEQSTSGRDKDNKFTPYMDIHSLEIEQTDAEDVDISPDERERIEALADGAEGDPLELAADSFAPKIYGHTIAKKAMILALVGGSRTEYQSGGFDRGEFHVLLVGDPSTAKSKLVQKAEQIGWRAVGVSGKGATVAGVTATATQDDFSGGDWTLESGAFVKANKGVVPIDELDDMPKEVRAAILEPMSNQQIHVSKGGINATLETRTAVVAAANPEKGRFDQYEPIPQQFSFTSTLLSRFDLVFTFKDKPDPDYDDDVAEHVLAARDGAKRDERGLEVDTTGTQAAVVNPPVEPEMLRSWIALAKRQPKPVFADESVKAGIKEQFNTFRGMYDYDENDPVPITFRKLEAIVRIAEAAAKFEFSQTIEHRHVEIATELVGESMRDVGRDADGEYDADMIETGESKCQRDRRRGLLDLISEMQEERESGDVAIDTVVDKAVDELNSGKNQIEHDISEMLNDGQIYEPETGRIRHV